MALWSKAGRRAFNPEVCGHTALGSPPVTATGKEVMPLDKKKFTLGILRAQAARRREDKKEDEQKDEEIKNYLGEKRNNPKGRKE